MRRDQRGAAALELVLLVPVLVLVLCVVVAGWRLWTARTALSDAAASAARAATLETSGGAARERAERVARAGLDVEGLHCDEVGVDVDTSGFATLPGTTSHVEVSTRCTLSTADLLVPGLPGTWQLEATGRHRMDTFRERTP
ncbi:TadE/TadG family type IV pilus assembly protein [Luteococcus peritonei]|uniref:TadE/TadG family type IV pilus assembly protein n=1 Tax=Luteococcus peritonei TaxID=88874 RepID=A0ABW4RUG8_9ACTN